MSAAAAAPLHNEIRFPSASTSPILSWQTFAVECFGVLSLQWDRSDVLEEGQNVSFVIRGLCFML